MIRNLLALGTAILLIPVYAGAQAKPAPAPALNLKTAQTLVLASLKEKQHWSADIRTASGAFSLVQNFAPPAPGSQDAQTALLRAEWSKMPGSATVVEEYNATFRLSADRKAWTLSTQDLGVVSSSLKAVPLPSKNALLQIVLKAFRNSSQTLSLLPRAQDLVAFHVVDAYPRGVESLEQSWTFSRPAAGTWRADYSITLPLVLDFELFQASLVDPETSHLSRLSGTWALVLERNAADSAWKLSGLPLVAIADQTKEEALGSWPSTVRTGLPTLATDGLDLVWGRQQAWNNAFGTKP